MDPKPHLGSWVHHRQFPCTHLHGGMDWVSSTWATRTWGWDFVKDQKPRSLPSNAQQKGWTWAKTQEHKLKQMRLNPAARAWRYHTQQDSRDLKKSTGRSSNEGEEGGVATHVWDLHKYLYITEKHRSLADWQGIQLSLLPLGAYIYPGWCGKNNLFGGKCSNKGFRFLPSIPGLLFLP